MMTSDVFSVPISSTKILPQELAQNPNPKPTSNPSAKKKRNLPGNPDPDAEVIALSPKTLMTKNRFVCEICSKGFQRDQNLQLHRRGHNLPWKLKQRLNKDHIKKKVYVCPEKTCVHHDPARALGDLTGVKKHFSRKHGEKKWKCDKCSKRYAVHSDWKAHSKTCGTREYKCDCGTLFSRRDSFITHRAFCDALVEENSRITTAAPNLSFIDDSNSNAMSSQLNNLAQRFSSPGGISHLNNPSYMGNNINAAGSSLVDHHQHKPRSSLWLDHAQTNNSQLINHHCSNLYIPSSNSTPYPDQMMQMAPNLSCSNYSNLSLSPLPPPQNLQLKEETMVDSFASFYNSDQNRFHNSSKSSNSTPMSATALLQKAAQMGSTKTNPSLFANSTTAGLMNISSPPSIHNRSELHQVFGKNPDQINVNPDVKDGPADKTMNLDQSSLTRDFLGMGRGGGGPMFFPQELANLASMSSAVALSHFISNNH